jgi:hypothetical protein
MDTIKSGVEQKVSQRKQELLGQKQEEVGRVLDVVRGMAEVELRQLAEVLVSKPNRELLGATEFLVRDGVHRIGVRLIEAALEERKKRGIAGRA